MIASILNNYLRTGDFQATNYFFQYYKGHLSSNDKLLWQVKISFHQGLYKDALKYLEIIILDPDSSVPFSSPSLYYCYLYKILIEGLIFNQVAVGLQKIQNIQRFIRGECPELQGFSFEVGAKLNFLGIKLQIINVENYKEGLRFFKQAIKFYQLANVTYQYYIVQHQLLKLSHEYEENHDSDKVFIILQKQSMNDQLPTVEAEIILSRIHENFITINSSTEIKRLIEINQQTPFFLGQGKLFLLKSKALFKKGHDGRPLAQKAICLFKKITSYSNLIEAWNEYSQQSIHFSDLKNASLGYQKSLFLAQKMGLELSQAHALMGLGECFYRMGEFGQAIQYYEMAQNLAESSILTPLLGMNLANIYSQMNLKNKAINIAQLTINSLRKNATNPKGLSLAYYILGNILVSFKKWNEAKQCWTEGLALDQKEAYYKELSEKWISLGWTHAQEIYQKKGVISKEQLINIKTYCFKAINALEKAKPHQERIIAEAQIHQTFAHISILAKSYDIAFLELDKALALYQDHQLNMQAANTLALKGLIAYQIAQQANTKYWKVAFDSYNSALLFFQKEKMKIFTWRINYYLADIVISLSAFFPENKLQYYLTADEYLSISHQDIQAMRQEFKHQNILEADAGRLGLIADKSKVYILALKINISLTKDYIKAFFWLEQLKSRALLDSLQSLSSNIKDIDSNRGEKNHFEQEHQVCQYFEKLKKSLTS